MRGIWANNIEIMQDCQSDDSGSVDYINNCQRSTYILGLDSSAGTYITDYIGAAVCIYLAGIFTRIRAQSKEIIPGDGRQDITRKNSIPKQCHEELLFWARSHCNTVRSVANALTGSLIASALMHLLAGLAHHLINYVNVTNSQYTTGEEISQAEFASVLVQVLPVYFLWQAAKLFISTFALFFVLTAFYIMLCKANQHHDVFPSNLDLSTSSDAGFEDVRGRSFGRRLFAVVKKHERNIEISLLMILCVFCLFHTVAAVSATVKLTYSMRESCTYREIADIWTLQTMAYLIAICLFIFLMISILLSIDQKHMRKMSYLYDAGPETSRHELLRSTADETSLNESRRRKSNTVNDVRGIHQINSGKLGICITRCIGIAIMIVAGLMQYFLSFRCGLRAPKDVVCPLPTDFNHNALYHVVFVLGIVVVCNAESRNFAREAQVIRQITTILHMRQ